MKVFCPEHKKGFFAPRQSPIRCENHGHVLGELNFGGEPGAQVELQWQYCCNCEHFCPISSEQETMERCPVCTRRISSLYACDRCLTVSFESDTPIETKNFTLTPEALPQPSCPGCLQETSGEAREHFCDELGASFTTALNACPICLERLDIGPTFPCLVAKYLSRTKAANKFPATFDYDSGLFVHIDDGEFVIVTNDAGTEQAVLLPRLDRLANPRQFYELYQDYYHHSSKLRAGNVRVNEPALVERSGDGWRFQAPGLLEVVNDKPKAGPRSKIRMRAVETSHRNEEQPVMTTRAPRKIRSHEIETETRAETPPSIAESNEEVPGKVCSQCGSMVEERYAFCWHCGNSMKSAESDVQPENGRQSSRLIIEVDDAATAQSRRGLGTVR